jgi:hypothetical protein
VTFYYLCSYPLGNGSVVQKGNWGRIIKINPITPHTLPYLLRELIFEKIRLEEYPYRPSRLNSIMACANLESAKEFKSLPGRQFDIIYEVEPLDIKSKLFEADWSLILPPLNKSIAQVEQEARNYWSGFISHENKKEILIDSDIRIIKKIDI